MNKKHALKIIFIVCVIYLQGCSLMDKSAGDLMIQHGMVKAGVEWEKGNAMIEESHKLIVEGRKNIENGMDILENNPQDSAQGNSLVKKGNELLKIGTNMLKDGKKMTTASEAKFNRTHQSF